ncbi:MAG: hydroxymethylpyrimidine/phosphomethylpyrimidine kinase [Chromatiales bacterium]|jgi:hydroxymethylpyrimidine/phosphomethylpyrimidine kinase
MIDRPTVLCFSGLDPTGGAGIQADIEAINANGGRASSIVTALTVQNSTNLSAISMVETGLIRQQFQALVADLRIDAVKIGLLGSAETAAVVAELLGQLSGVPVVLDPVLAAGGGAEVADRALVKTILQQLCPLTTLITPNSLEARRLSGADSIEASATRLRQAGCKNSLITGTHEASKNVVNRLFLSDGSEQALRCQRLDGDYHGSGCTLASSIAAQLARGRSVIDAVRRGQQYTYASLLAAEQPGRGQQFPLRWRPEE